MALQIKFYHRNRPSRQREYTPDTQKSDLVFLDVTPNHQLLTDQRLEVRVFSIDEVDACVDYMTSGAHNISLFISVNIEHMLIPIIYQIEYIKRIFILDEGKLCNRYRILTPIEPYRFRVSFAETETRYNSFQQGDVTTTMIHSVREASFEIIREGAEKVRWWHSFDKTLLHIHNTETARNEFLQLVQEFYHDDKIWLRQIDEFKNTYTHDKAIQWYTRDGFLYRFLNQAYRTQNNINTLFKLRFIVPNLLVALQNEQANQLNASPDFNEVYRGQFMSMEEVELLRSNVGGLISANSFLSTSMVMELALIFAGQGDDISCQSVLLRITIDFESAKRSTIPFADISHMASFLNENEVLFAPHAMFRIQAVELIDKIWLVELWLEDGFWNEDFGDRSIFSPHAEHIYIRHLSKDNLQFLGFQVLVDMVLRLEQSRYAKEELIEFCRLRCSADEMKEFETTYKSTDALKWYTKDSFLYRILHESLRIETIDSIVKMRYYIQDLHNQLAELQLSFIDSLNGKTLLTLYRGLTMKTSVLQELKENIHGLVAMNSFISVTQVLDVAIMYSGDGKTTETDQVSVIYEITVDTNIRSTPYAKIYDSVFKDEQEILFSMGATFRIDEVGLFLNREDIHCVKLTMVHVEDERWDKLTAHLD